MLHNSLYNLMMQLTVENKSLWRIKNEYMQDAEQNQDVIDYLKRLAADKEDHIRELTELVRKLL